MLPRELGLLLLLVPVLAVVHDPRDRRVGLRRDLHEIEALVVSEGARVVGRLDAELLAVVPDQPDARHPDLVVHARPVLRRALGRPTARPAPGPQRALTKLSLPPS